MKLLLIYADRFAYTPTVKTIEDAPDAGDGFETEKSIVAFIQGEPRDEENPDKTVTKLIKQIKWLSGKLECRSIVLHSFAHLSSERGSPVVVNNIINRARDRLESVGYKVHCTPFGYFLALEVRAPGFSLARVFKEF